MNVSELATRYKVSTKQIRQVLKENYVDINSTGTNAECNKHEWSVNDEGVEWLDNYLNYQPPVEEAPIDEVSRKDSELIAANAQVTTLRAQVDELKDALQKATLYQKNLQSEYDALQNKFLSAQEGKDSANSILIRKYKAEAESKQKEVAMLNKRLDALTESSNKTHAEQQARIEDLLTRLSDQQEILNEKLKADVRATEAKKNEEKLYVELNQRKLDSEHLKNEIQSVNMQKEAKQKVVEDMRLQIVQVLHTLEAATTQLTSASELGLSDSEHTETAVTVSQAIVKETTKQNLAVKKQINQKQAKTPAKTELTITHRPEYQEHKPMESRTELVAQSKEQERLMNELREAQQETKDVTTAKEEPSVMSRVASFFGFM